MILQNWILPDTGFEAVMAAYLYEKSLLTVRYSFVAPTIIYVVPTLYIKVLLGYSISYVQSLIELALASQFVLGTTTKLGTAKRQSDITAAIENTEGVSYSHVLMKVSKQLLEGYNSSYTWATTVDALPMLASAVEIYIDDVKIGADTGTGTLIGVGSTYSVTGVSVYATGFVGANVTPAPPVSSTVYVRYLQDQNGDIVTTKSQVCKLLKTVYTTISYVS
jgi:hypothetical protein